VDVLERFGIGTLGELAELAPAALADRFGSEGLAARELARGGGPALRPRPAAEGIAEWIELPEAASGPQLERALELLVRRLLAGSARRGRSFRRVRLSARLAAGGSWSSTVTLRRASASHDRLRLALGPRLEQLPGPAAKLGIEALVLGPPPQDQLSLVEARSGRAGHESHQRRLAEAVRQARAAAGRDAVLRVLDLDPGSRIPERRAMLAPF
jgi:protein ImuB